MAYIIEELEGSPTFSFGQNEGSAVRIVRIDWADIEPFCKQQLGERWGGGGGVGDARTLSSAWGWLYVDTIDVEPMLGHSPAGNAASPSSDLNTYSAGAKVTLHYKSTENSGDTTGGLTVNLSVSAEFMTIKTKGAIWETGSVPVNADDLPSIGFLDPKIEHKRSYKDQASIPYSAIRAALGKINSSTWNGVNAEYVMFTGCQITAARAKTGQILYGVDYTYSEKVRSWNKFFRPDTCTFDYISFAGQRPFATTSFSSIEP